MASLRNKSTTLSKHLYKNIVKKFPSYLRRRLPKQILVVAISSSRLGQLNQQYRKENKPPDVLSFRYGKDYGEILVCPAVIRREAKKQGNSYKYQMTWMIVHGMLHLAEIHHEKSKISARKVEKIELEILTRFSKIKN